MKLNINDSAEYLVVNKSEPLKIFFKTSVMQINKRNLENKNHIYILEHVKPSMV